LLPSVCVRACALPSGSSSLAGWLHSSAACKDLHLSILTLVEGGGVLCGHAESLDVLGHPPLPLPPPLDLSLRAGTAQARSFLSCTSREACKLAADVPHSATQCRHPWMGDLAR
jgi:hypothetical protein